MSDSVNHPSHYTTHASGVECIDIVEHMSFNLGNAIKYLWRAGLKSPNWEQDLQKASWYVNREIERLRKLYGKKHHTEEQRAHRQATEGGAREAAGDTSPGIAPLR